MAKKRAIAGVFLGFLNKAACLMERYQRRKGLVQSVLSQNFLQGKYLWKKIFPQLKI